jgi:PAS domain-containing protein
MAKDELTPEKQAALMIARAAILDEVIGEEDRLLTFRQQASERMEAGARVLALAGLLAVSARLLAQARARLALSEGEQRRMAEQMRAAFDSLSQGIGVFGPDGRLTRWNDCFNILLDLPPPMMRAGTPYEAIVEQAAARNAQPDSRIPSDRPPPCREPRRRLRIPARRRATSRPPAAPTTR